MDNIQMIGESIRFLRQKNGFSQEELALNSGINTSYVGQIERGEKNPTIKTLEKLAFALKTTIVDLLTLYDPIVKELPKANQVALVIDPKVIKQCMLEVLIEHTDLVPENGNSKSIVKGDMNHEERS